jgi:hypothetical protein
MSIEEYARQVACLAAAAGFDEECLRAQGGRRAVLESIRRHVPDFDPAEAQHENAPAWQKLKPVLRRRGLSPIDETVTLADIKTFLDDPDPDAGRARLREGAPASNLADIASLIGAAEVQAVFDPYLDNKSLLVLGDILSLGVGVSGSLRLLACEKMAKGTRPRLTKTFVSCWLGECGITAGEVRLMPDSEHRRFLLLSGGLSLLLGMSLNSVDKNETARLEPDAEDRAFFDGVWATATPLS